VWEAKTNQKNQGEIMIITYDNIKEWGHSDQKLKQVMGNGKTPKEIFDLDLPNILKLWILLREEIMGQKELQLLVCDIAEHVASIEIKCSDDIFLANIINAKKEWINKKINTKELIEMCFFVASLNNYKILLTNNKLSSKIWAISTCLHAATLNVMTLRDTALSTSFCAMSYMSFCAKENKEREYGDKAGKDAEEKEAEYQLGLVKKILLQNN
jgi:hypothetical protein